MATVHGATSSASNHVTRSFWESGSNSPSEKVHFKDIYNKLEAGKMTSLSGFSSQQLSYLDSRYENNLHQSRDLMFSSVHRAISPGSAFLASGCYQQGDTSFWCGSEDFTPSGFECLFSHVLGENFHGTFSEEGFSVDFKFCTSVEYFKSGVPLGENLYESLARAVFLMSLETDEMDCITNPKFREAAIRGTAWMKAMGFLYDVGVRPLPDHMNPRAAGRKVVCPLLWDTSADGSGVFGTIGTFVTPFFQQRFRPRGMWASWQKAMHILNGLGVETLPVDRGMPIKDPAVHVPLKGYETDTSVGEEGILLESQLSSKESATEGSVDDSLSPRKPGGLLPEPEMAMAGVTPDPLVCNE